MRLRQRDARLARIAGVELRYDATGERHTYLGCMLARHLFSIAKFFRLRQDLTADLVPLISHSERCICLEFFVRPFRFCSSVRRLRHNPRPTTNVHSPCPAVLKHCLYLDVIVMLHQESATEEQFAPCWWARLRRALSNGFQGSVPTASIPPPRLSSVGAFTFDTFPP